jgi:hypothetical protein
MISESDRGVLQNPNVKILRNVVQNLKEVQGSDRYMDSACPLNIRAFFSFVFSQAQ